MGSDRMLCPRLFRPRLSMRNPLATLISSGAAFLVLTSGAVAAPSLHTVRLSAAGLRAGQGSAAISAAGVRVASFEQGRRVVVASTRSRRWTKPKPLGRGFDPRIVSLSDGRFLVVWLRNDNGAVLAAVGSSSAARWSKPIVVGRGHLVGYDGFRVAAGGGGVAAVLWADRTTTSGARLFVSNFSAATKRFGRAQEIASRDGRGGFSNSGANDPGLAVNQAGATTAAWTVATGQLATAYRAPNATTWRVTDPMQSSHKGCTELYSLSVLPGDSFAALWSSVEPGPRGCLHPKLLIATAGSGGWANPMAYPGTPDEQTSGLGNARIVPVGNQLALLYCVQRDDGGGPLRVRLGSGDAWSNPADLAPECSSMAGAVLGDRLVVARLTGRNGAGLSADVLALPDLTQRETRVLQGPKGERLVRYLAVEKVGRAVLVVWLTEDRAVRAAWFSSGSWSPVQTLCRCRSYALSVVQRAGHVIVSWEKLLRRSSEVWAATV